MFKSISAEVTTQDKQNLKAKIHECQHCFKENVSIRQSCEAVVNGMDAVTSLLTVFKSESKVKSKLFSFWEQYIAMVMILLHFIKAERTGNWNLLLPCTAAMVPHFFAMD